MSPTNFHDHKPKKTNNMYPPPLKLNKDSHMIIKKSSTPSSSPPLSSSSSSASSLGTIGFVKPPQRRPVIIYTHSPKIIHTHPKDFMALVQKLTGLSRSEDDPAPQVKQANGNRVPREENKINVGNDDNETFSAITDENCGSICDIGQVNSCFMPPIISLPSNPNNYMTNIPVFEPNSAEFLCANQPFYNYTDPLFFPSPNMRNSISTTSTLEVKNEFCG